MPSIGYLRKHGSEPKEYSFPIVRFRNGSPVSFFRKRIVYAEYHEQTVKKLSEEIASLRAENDKLRTLRVINP